MDYRYMTKQELIAELNKRDFELVKNRARIKQLSDKLHLYSTGQFLSRTTRKALSVLLSTYCNQRADFDVGALEYNALLDIYTYYDEFGMKLCLRTTDTKIT